MWILILKNHFDSKKISFINCLHIPTKNSQNFSIQLQETTIYKRHCYTIYIYIYRKKYRSPKIYLQVRAKHKANPPSSNIPWDFALQPFSNVHGKSRINNRQWNVNDRHVSTIAVSTLWVRGGGGRGRECLDLGLRKDLPVTSTREFRAKYLFIRLWYA